jgi:hypothetical protein
MGGMMGGSGGMMRGMMGGGGMMGGDQKKEEPPTGGMAGMSGMMRGMMGGGGMMGGDQTKKEPPTGRMMGKGGSVKRQDGFVPLFNGVDLTGWKEVLDNGSQWIVENGILEGRGGGGQPGQPGLLLTDRRDFTDFRLRIKARYPENGYGRIEIRHVGADDNMSGYHVAHGEWGEQHVPAGTIGEPLEPRYSAAFDWSQKAERVPLLASDWHTVEITVVSNRITVSVNGKMVQDFTDFNSRYGSGGIAMICGYNSHVQIQDIAIKEFQGGSNSRRTPRREAPRSKLTPKKAAGQNKTVPFGRGPSGQDRGHIAKDGGHPEP